MGKDIIVTGGTKGLGLSIAQIHAKMGHRVFIPTLLLSDDLSELSGQYKESVFPLICNLESTDDVQGAFDFIKSKTTQIDILYNVAGLFYFSERVPITQTSMEKAMKMYNVNALGILRVFSQAEPLLHSGAVAMNVTSESASLTDCHRTQEYGYSMSKAAANMACKTFANANASRGVRVFCIHPGWLKTDMGGEDAMKSENAITPAQSAQDITQIAINPHSIPPDVMFLDHNRKPLAW